MLSDKERQRRFREKMYNAGLKQVVLWTKAKKWTVRMEPNEFMRRLKKLISGWNDDDISGLLNLFITITEAKKEVKRLRRKD